MLLSNYEDSQLLSLVKEDNDSEALKELVNRHSGIYISIIERYSHVPYFEKQELLDHRMVNIYSYALDFDSSRGCKFSSFVGDRIKWQCKSLLKKYPDPQQLPDEIEDEKEILSEIEEQEILDILKAESQSLEDPRFYKIFLMRIRNPKPATWTDIGKEMGMSDEGARKFFYKKLKILENKIKNKTY